MESKLLGLFHDPDRYAKAFKIFAASSDKYSDSAQWVETVFGEAVVAKLRVGLDGQEPLRVLGMGSGSGEIDVTLLTSLLRRFPNINNRVVEPAKNLLDQYKALVQTKAHYLHGVVCDWRQQTIDQYEEAGDLTKFHFISTVHSIYYADNVDNSLMYLYNLVEPGGVLLVITNADNGFWRMRKRFPQLLGDYQHYVSSADVRSFFDRQDIPYNQYHQACYLDITQCFDETSEDGRLLVDFLTHVLKFQDTAPEDLKREVMEYLACGDCSEKKADGQVLFNIHWEGTVVCKPLE